MFTSQLKNEDKMELLDWTSKQGRILTANGRASEFYTSERGFPFHDHELPHHHLLSNNTHSTFSSWSRENPQKEINIIRGAFDRPLFHGGWENSTNKDEICFNIQTSALFIDLRIPRLGDKLFSEAKSLNDLSDEEIKLYARRHVFGGYTKVNIENDRTVCTRHHCIDWNFTGNPRPRPNKWYVEINDTKELWKEWAFAKDDFGQHYYCERWQRYEGDGKGQGFVLAMRKEFNENDDGIIVAVGNHFNYLFANQGWDKNRMKGNNTIELIDDAIDTGNRSAAENHLLSIDAGHGLIKEGWTIQDAIHPWKKGVRLFGLDSTIQVQGSTIESCKVVIDGISWEILECSVTTSQLELILNPKKDGDKDSFCLDEILLGINRKRKVID
jgi:hypothetical protein